VDLFLLLLPAIVILVLIAVLAVLAERSLKRQQGSKLRRGREESNAAGRVLEKYFRW
jgi:hypothetical protein